MTESKFWPHSHIGDSYACIFLRPVLLGRRWAYRVDSLIHLIPPFLCLLLEIIVGLYHRRHSFLHKTITSTLLNLSSIFLSRQTT